MEYCVTKVGVFHLKPYIINSEALDVNIESPAEITAMAKHDLGKYIAFESRWLSDDCSDEELIQALQSDILRTANSPSQVKSAFDIWEDIRPALVSAVGAEQVGPVATLMNELEQYLPMIDDYSLAKGCRDDLERVRDVANSIGKALSVLHRETKG